MKNLFKKLVLLIIGFLALVSFLFPIGVVILTSDPLWYLLFLVSWIPGTALTIFLFVTATVLFEEQL